MNEISTAPADAAPSEPLPSVCLPPCPACQAPRIDHRNHCGDCGFIFSAEESTVASGSRAQASRVRLRQRYEVLERRLERGGTEWLTGLDHGVDSEAPEPVVLVRAAAPPTAEAVTGNPRPDETLPDEIVPSFDIALQAAAEPAASPEEAWPSLAWLNRVLEKADHNALPRVLDSFAEDSFDYLVLESPTGKTLWDAWDDPDATFAQRFDWLRQIAEALQQLHRAGAIFEGLRPDGLVLTADGRLRFIDLSGLLPLPLPGNVLIRDTHYTAAELVFTKEQADARADLYHFGAMLYSLHMGRELADMDFERPGVPKDFFPVDPEVHPLFGRLVAKTFRRDTGQRFPTEEAAREDPTGFAELIRSLEVCGRMLDHVRLDIGAWTTTGMVRTGNEDAMALLHAVEAREDELVDTALVVLCDGMGGYESGEVAARMAIETVRDHLVQQQPFASLAGGQAGHVDPEHCRNCIAGALKEANQRIFTSARGGTGRPGMGCTAEVVYVNGRHLFVGHVGDSRTYLLRDHRLTQLTRDQTLVNRLVELGQLTPDEAERHPRRSELQQALGGHPDVEVELHHHVLKAGDFVVVCSDGLPNHVLPDTLKDMLLSCGSAETAARRLINLANLEGAGDNASVVVLRIT